MLLGVAPKITSMTAPSVQARPVSALEWIPFPSPECSTPIRPVGQPMSMLETHSSGAERPRTRVRPCTEDFDAV